MKAGYAGLGIASLFAVHADAQVEGAERYRSALLKRPENAVMFGRFLDAWLESGDLAGLKAFLEQKAKEGGAADWRLLAVFRAHSGDEAGAVVALDEAIRKEPEDATVRLARAKALGAALRFEAALADLALAGKEPALALEAGTLKGKLLARAGKPAEAVAAWKEVIAANPADEGLREDLVELEVAEGMMEEAVTAARELAEKSTDPYKKALRRLRVAEVLGQAGKRDEAVAEYRSVFGVSAEGSWLEREVLARMAILFSREDDTAGLAELYGQMRNEYPRRVAVKKETAKILLAGGEKDEAVAMFREVLKVLPGDRAVREEFIAMLEGAERFGDAAEEIAALLATAERDATLWERQAGVLQAKGDKEGAAKAVERAVALVPEGEGGKVAAARLYERFGPPEKAEALLRDAVAAHGSGGEAGEALAAYLIKAGKPDDAVTVWAGMAKEADREGLLRVSRSLVANGRAADAYDILRSREEAFKGDTLLLAALVQAAQAAGKDAEAMPLAVELVKRSATTTDLEPALRQAVTLIGRAGEAEKKIGELAALGKPTIQEICLLAELHESVGDSIEASRVLQQAMTGEGALMAASQRVRLCEMRGDSVAAAAAIREWLGLPGGAKAAQMKKLVELLERSGDNTGALAETENWKRLAPSDRQAWMRRAQLLSDEGMVAEAAAELRRAIAKFGVDEELRAKLAESLAEAGANDEAWRTYSALYDESESTASKVKWASQLAKVAMREGRESELEADFRRRSRDNPGSVVPLLALAEMFREWQRADDELAVVAEASRRKPDDTDLLYRLADLEESAGSMERAEALLRTAARLREGPDGRRRLSAFWTRNGEEERGLAELLAAGIGGSPREIERNAMSLVAAGNWETIIEMLQGAGAKNAGDWRLEYFLAAALRQGGREDEAFTRFTGLLQSEGDLAGVLPVMSSPQMQMGYQPNVAVPVEATFISLRRAALAHRDQQRGRYGFGHMGGGIDPVILPGSAEEARWMALGQALSLAEEHPDERPGMLARIQSGKIVGIEFFKSAIFQKPEEIRAQLMGANPDPQLYRWYMHSRQMNPFEIAGRPANETDLYRHCSREFAAKDPVLSLQLLAALPVKGEGHMTPEEATRLYEGIEAQPANSRLPFLSTLSVLIFGDDASVPAVIRQKSQALLLKLAEENPGDYMAFWVTRSLPVQMMTAGKFDEAVAMINRRYDTPVPLPAQLRQRQMYSGYFSYGRGGDMRLTLQSALAGNVDETLAQQLGQQGGGNASPARAKLLNLLQASEVTPSLIDREKIAKAIPSIKDPFLRVYLADMLARPDDLAKAVEDLEKLAASDGKAGRVVAAYYLNTRKDPGKAFAVLAAARDAANPAEVNDRLDLDLVTVAVELVGKDAKFDIETAKRAALRLRKSLGKDQNTRPMVVEYLNKLGLAEEGRRLVETKVSPNRANGYMSSMRGSARGNSDPTQEVTKLVAEGKRDAAARKLFAELGRVTPNANTWHMRENWIRLVTSLNLSKELLAISQPGEGASYSRRKRHALLQVELKQAQAALPALRIMAAERADDPEIISALIPAVPVGERAGLVEKMAGGKIDEDGLASWLSGVVDGRSQAPAAELLDSLDVLASFLEKIDPSSAPERNLTWVNYHVYPAFSERGRRGGQALRPIWSEPRQGEKYDEALSERQKEVAKKLLLAMLRHPQTCEQGFFLLSAKPSNLGLSAAELDQAALRTIAVSSLKNDKATTRNMGYQNSRQIWWMWVTPNGGGRGRGEPDARGEDAVAYVGRRVAEGATLDPYDAEVIANLKKSDPLVEQRIQEAKKMTASSGTASLDAWLKSPAGKAADSSKQLLWILRIAVLENRSDLLASAIDTISERYPVTGNQGMSGVDQAEMGDLLTLAIQGVRDRDGKVAALKQISLRFLGPQEAWPLYAEAGLERQYVPVISQRTQAYQYFCRLFAADPAWAPTLVRFMALNGLSDIGGGGFDLRSTGRQTNAASLAEEWLKGGLFKDGPELACRIGRDETILVETARQSLSQWGDPKGAIAVLNKAEGADRFWARLTAAALAGETAGALAELDREADAISKWPEQARRDLGKVVTGWFPTAATAAKGKTGKLLADAAVKAQENSRVEVERYLKEGFGDDLMMRGPDKFISMVWAMVPDDPELAARLWNKVKESTAASRQYGSSGRNGYVVGSSYYVVQSLLQGHERRKITPVETAALLAASANVDELDFEQFGYYLTSSFQTDLQRRKAEYAARKDVAGLPESLRGYAGQVAALAEDCSPGARPMLGALIALEINRSNRFQSDDARTAMREWARKSLVKIDPSVADLLILGITSKSNDAPSIKEFPALAAAFAGNGKVLAGLRFSILAELAKEGAGKSALADPACAQAVASVGLEFLKTSGNWATRERIRILTGIAAGEGLSKDKSAELLAGVQANPPSIQANDPGDAGGEVSGLLITLSLRTGDPETVALVIRRHGDQLRGRMERIIDLWKRGHSASAVQLLARPGEYHRGNVWYFLPPDAKIDWQFSKSMEAALPGWLETIQDPAQRFRVECLISCAPDEAGDAAPVVNRLDRLTALRKRLPAEGPKTRAALLETICAICREPLVANTLGDELAELSRGADLLSFISSRPTGSGGIREPAAEIMITLIRHRIRVAVDTAGDAGPMVKQIAPLATISDSGNMQYYARDLIRKICEWYGPAIAGKIMATPSNGGPALPGQALELAAALLAYEDSLANRTAVSLAIASQACAGNGAALDAWLDKLPEEPKKRYRVAREQGLQNAFRSFRVAPHLETLYPDFRQKVMASILNDRATWTREIKQVADIAQWIDSGFCSAEQMEKVISTILAEHPERVTLLASKAGILGWRLNREAESRATYQEAEEAAKGDEKQGNLVRYLRLRYVGSHLKKLDEAKELAGGVNADLLTEKEREELKKLLARAGAKPDKEKQ